MRFKSFSLLIVFIFSITSCNEKKVTTEYYSTGEILKEYQVVNGNKNGYYKEYYKNGVIRFESEYLDNEPILTSKGYDENGKLLYETFQDSCYKYQDDGLIGKGVLKNDKMTGWWKFYYEGKNEYYLKEFITVPEEDVYENQNIVFKNDIKIDSLSDYYIFKKDILSNDTIRLNIKYNSSTLTEYRSILRLIYSKDLDKDFFNQRSILFDTIFPKSKGIFEFKYSSKIPFRGFITEDSYVVKEAFKGSDDLNVTRYKMKMYLIIN